MNILKTDLIHTPRKDFMLLRNALRAGQVLMYPCDTCWALSCSLQSQEGIQKIFAIKERSPNKSVSLAFGDLAQADRYVEISPEVRQFVQKYMPERLTLILPVREGAIPAHFQTQNGTVGVRIPKDPLTRRLALAVGAPIITTSANTSGEEPVYTWKEVEQFLRKGSTHPDIILYKENHQKTPPSTLITTVEQPWEILRQGSFIL